MKEAATRPRFRAKLIEMQQGNGVGLARLHVRQRLIGFLKAEKFYPSAEIGKIYDMLKSLTFNILPVTVAY